MNVSVEGDNVARSGQVVDFRRPAPLLVDQAKLVRAVQDDLAERLSPMLSSRLRTPCRFIVADQEMVSGDELHAESAERPVTAVIDSPIGAQLVWRFPIQLASIVVDLLLGGSGRGETAVESLTEIEVQVLGRLVEQCLASLSVAWTPLLQLRPRLVAVQTDPEALLPIAAGEPALRVRFRVVLGPHDLESAIWIPNGMLAAALRGLEPAQPVPGQRAVDAIGGGALDVEVLRSVPIGVTVAFPPVPMTPAAILDLAVGDVIPLHPVVQPLELSAGDVRIGWVLPAQHAGRTACQVTTLDRRSPLTRS